MEVKSIAIACLILLCINSGHSNDTNCFSGCPVSSNKDEPQSTTCNPKKFDCKLVMNSVTHYKSILEPLYQKVQEGKELSAEDKKNGLTIVNAYYSRLIAVDVPYARLAKDVVNDEGTFAQLANTHLRKFALAEGKSEEDIRKIMNNIRISLAYHDAQLRSLCPRFVTYQAIAKYHYCVFGKQGLSPYAWGGALFEEFAGSGSWMNLGGYDTRVHMYPGALVTAIACNKLQNGIKARTAAISVLPDSMKNVRASSSVIVDRILKEFKSMKNIPRQWKDPDNKLNNSYPNAKNNSYSITTNNSYPITTNNSYPIPVTNFYPITTNNSHPIITNNSLVIPDE